MKPSMSPKRRFLAAMMGRAVDCTPVGNVVSVITMELMDAAEAWSPQAHLEAVMHLACGWPRLLFCDLTPYLVATH